MVDRWDVTEMECIYCVGTRACRRHYRVEQLIYLQKIRIINSMLVVRQHSFHEFLHNYRENLYLENDGELV
jgi:hypothetical protein